MKKYWCQRFGIVDFVICKNQYKAHLLLKTAQTNINIDPSVFMLNYKPDVCYRIKNSETFEINFDYSKQKKSNSPNSLSFYTTRGLSKDEAQFFLKKHQAEAGGLMGPNRQKKNCPSSIHFWRQKFNNETEAQDMFKEFQKKSLTYFEYRYGSELGKLKYETHYQKRKESMSKKHITLIKNLSHKENIEIAEAASLYYHSMRSISPRRVEYWLKRGFSQEDAMMKVKLWQSEISPRCLHFWLKNGYNIEEARLKVSEFQDTLSIDKIIKRYNCSRSEADDIQQSILSKGIETKSLKGLVPHLEDKIFFFLYKKEVERITKKTYNKFWQVIDPDKKRSREYVLDHCYSILNGFLNDVPPIIIGSVHNLKIISNLENSKKGKDNSTTLEKLMFLYENNTSL